MYAVALLSAICFLATTVFTAPAKISATSPPFQITKLQLHEIQGHNTTISFTVHDPDPLTNATQECSARWKTGSGGYPQGSYEPCGNSTFAWNMASYDNIESFVIGLEHLFVDPAVGQPPYDEVITFGQANVTAPSMWCTAMGGHASCQQHRNSTIKAPITAETA